MVSEIPVVDQGCEIRVSLKLLPKKKLTGKPLDYCIFQKKFTLPRAKTDNKWTQFLFLGFSEVKRPHDYAPGSAY